MLVAVKEANRPVKVVIEMTKEEAEENRIKLAAFEEEKRKAKEAALKAAEEKKGGENV